MCSSVILNTKKPTRLTGGEADESHNQRAVQVDKQIPKKTRQRSESNKTDKVGKQRFKNPQGQNLKTKGWNVTNERFYN